MTSTPEKHNYEEGLKPEEHVAEVNEMLEDVETRVENIDNTPFRVEYERTSPYREENKWEDETGMTRGGTSIHLEDKLTKPELHALGAQRLAEEYDIDASSVADLKLDGIGEKAAITSEYTINLKLEKSGGIKYELERKNVNAKDIDEQPVTENDLEYLETQIEGVLQEYSDINEASAGWNYGQEKVKALDD